MNNNKKNRVYIPKGKDIKSLLAEQKELDNKRDMLIANLGQQLAKYDKVISWCVKKGGEFYMSNLTPYVSFTKTNMEVLLYYSCGNITYKITQRGQKDQQFNSGGDCLNWLRDNIK